MREAIAENVLFKIRDTRVANVLVKAFREEGHCDIHFSAKRGLRELGTLAVEPLLLLLAESGGVQLGQDDVYIKDTNDKAFTAMELLGDIGDKRAAGAVLQTLFTTAPTIINQNHSCIGSKLFASYSTCIFDVLAGWARSGTVKNNPYGSSGEALHLFTYSVTPMVKATEDLGKIPSAIASNLLHLICQRKDPLVHSGAGYFGSEVPPPPKTLNLDKQRQTARDILEQRGNPPYDADAYLKVEDWNLTSD